MSNNRWVTGPALKTIIALNALQFGDELKIKVDPESGRGLMLDYCGSRAAHHGLIWVFCGRDNDPEYPIDVAVRRDRPTGPSDASDCCHPDDIKAWRRPKR